MNKGKKSLYTAVTSIAYTIIYGLLGLIVTRLIIANYGSDFNGLNSTANQFIGMLLILDGGFTLAINVSLFKPVVAKNYDAINKIMSASKIVFNRIGFLVFVVGIIGSIVYSMIAKSELPCEFAALIFMMSVIPVAFNFAYSTKYSILMKTEQKEYILNIIKILTTVLSQLWVLAAVLLHEHMLVVRFITMLGAILNSLLIGCVSKKMYNYLNFKHTPNYDAIKGTKDVLAQKVTNMLYGTAPIVFISATVGTMLASVYSVYNNVFMLLKSVLNAFIVAPRMGFGQLIAEKDSEYVKKVFNQYECIVILVMLCILSTTTVLIMPFIKLYMSGIADINYENWYVAALLIVTVFFEIIHIPSGNIINVSGKFEVGKKIQFIACITLAVTMIIGNWLIGFYGILSAVMITAIVLAGLEITYVHAIFFDKAYSTFFRIIIPSTTLTIFIVLAEMLFLPEIRSVLQFILFGISLTVINGAAVVIPNYLINRELMLEIYNRFQPHFNNLLRIRSKT